MGAAALPAVMVDSAPGEVEAQAWQAQAVATPAGAVVLEAAAEEAETPSVWLARAAHTAVRVWGALSFSMNSSTGGGSGGAINNNLGSLNITNSILAGNSATLGADIYNWGGSAVTAGGSNIVQALDNAGGTVTGAGSIFASDPLLATLGSYGGPTRTMPLQVGSPGIAAGSDAAGGGLPTDQRGHPRLVGTSVDIGAVEGVYDPAFPLIDPVRLGDGSFQFGFSNLSGLIYTVLAGTNAAAPINTWSNLGPAVESPPGTFQFTDPQATNYPRRFYRVTKP